MFWHYLWIVWLLSTPVMLSVYIYAIFHFRQFIFSPNQTLTIQTPELLFQVTTKGHIPTVQDTVDHIHASCEAINYHQYSIWVITDANEKYDRCQTIVVPSNFSCNAIYKGRALQYAVELRKQVRKNTSDIYIYHLDDESEVTTQTLTSILTYLETNPAPISEGLIIYPLQMNKSFLPTHLCDAIRPFCCYECIHFMSAGDPLYIHGSNLLVRSDIEEIVGWDNGKSIAEDTLFALIAKRKLGSHVFGWHGGVIEEQSPYTISDLVKQRKRWFSGLLMNLQYCSPRERIIQIFRALIWLTGFPSGIASMIAFIIPQYIPPSLNLVLPVFTLLWIGSYQIGALFNSKYLSFRRRLWFHVVVFVSTPVISLIESFTPYLALIMKPTTFDVVQKHA